MPKPLRDDEALPDAEVIILIIDYIVSSICHIEFIIYIRKFTILNIYFELDSLLGNIINSRHI